MHIGLIGGIGPAATVVYYQRLTALMRERGKKLDLTIVQASADELIANNLADNRNAQAEIYADLIGRLKAAGAECAAITSLGGHFCYPETEAISPLPLVSGVTPLDAYFVAQGLGTVGLLGTEVVMRTRLYGQLPHTRAVAPEGNLQDVGKTYLEMAVRGAATDADRAFFFEAGHRMTADQGADAIVLAGTDLGLAFDGHDPGYKVIDALDVHVALLADLATGRATLPQGTKG
ncbi:aspartate/glutamate racemase family protein [Roseobacter sp. YSTF-M11]|uniref:Aspartate/glutamate racemase family protein n=1 Tax=Roseobacter insulae TaxID=2859783 RepID=A0A9X1K1T4_9RHOB|nr:aspartate/glutamate racemase family protein [Roseobacter insulae]MBW4707848.1 aspartate/glutamate racemase family protein [Roseobacter insulae]